MPDAKSKGRTPIEKIKVVGLEAPIKVGDHILFKAEIPGAPPFIGKVTALWKDCRGKQWVQCRWFYRPEDTPFKRKQFHGAKEVFFSDWVDDNTPDTIVGRCRVLPIHEYAQLARVGEHDYFCRFLYDCRKKSFTPEEVQLYCCCERPFNPDDLRSGNKMIQCNNCTEWYHPKCVKLKGRKSMSEEEVATWQCPQCVSATEQ